MYKILIKHHNERSKNNNIWHIYGTISKTATSMSNTVETETFEEFETNDLNVLKDTIKELDKKYGYENIRVINDITYDVLINISASSDTGSNIEFTTSEDVVSLYNTAYKNVFE